MRKPLVASGGGFEAPSVKPVGDGGSAAQGLPARGVKATLGEGCGAKRVLVCVRGQGEPNPGSRGAGVVCRRPATAGLRRRGVGEWRPDNGVAYGLKGLAQKKARGSRVLTGGLGRPDCAAQGTGGEVRAVKTTRSPGRSRCGGRGRRRKVRGGSWRRGGAGVLLGRSSGVVERRSRGGAERRHGGAALLRRLGLPGGGASGMGCRGESRDAK